MKKNPLTFWKISISERNVLYKSYRVLSGTLNRNISVTLDSIVLNTKITLKFLKWKPLFFIAYSCILLKKLSTKTILVNYTNKIMRAHIHEHTHTHTSWIMRVCTHRHTKHKWKQPLCDTSWIMLMPPVLYLSRKDIIVLSESLFREPNKTRNLYLSNHI